MNIILFGNITRAFSFIFYWRHIFTSYHHISKNLHMMVSLNFF